MKRIYQISILVLGIILSGCAGQRMAKKTSIIPLLTGKVMPEQLVVKDGKVNYQYLLNIGPKVFPPEMVLKMTPHLAFNGGERIFSSFYLQGQGVVLTKYPVVRYKQGINTLYELSFPYQKGMDDAVLSMELEAWLCGRKLWTANAIMNDKGIKQPDPKIQPNPMVHPDMTGEIRSELMFRRNETEFAVDPKYLSYTRDNLDSLLKVPGAVLTRMEILVSCSPEGDFELNKQLAVDRYTVAKRFLTEYLGLNKISFFQNPDFLTYHLTYQNWQGLYDLIEDSHLTDNYQIINNLKNAPLEKRQLILRQLMKDYPIVENEFLPLLRRADFVIYYKRPYEEIKPTIVPGMW